MVKSDPTHSGASDTSKAMLAAAPAVLASLGVGVATFMSSSQRPLPVPKLSILGVSLIVYMIGVIGGLSKSIDMYSKSSEAEKESLKSKYYLDVANLISAIVIIIGGGVLTMKGWNARQMGQQQL